MSTVIKIEKDVDIIIDKYECGDCGHEMFSNGAPDYCQCCGTDFDQIESKVPQN